MALIWGGNVQADVAGREGGNLNLRDLQFCGSSASGDGSPLAVYSDAKLSFGAYVETQRVPFYLTCGPRLAVYTNDVETEETLWECLVAGQLPAHQFEIEDNHHGPNGSMEEDLKRSVAGLCPFESEIGILLEIEGARGPATEILLYAASDPVHPGNGASTSGLVTPPRSSSPTLPQDGPDTQALALGVRIFAQPLRSPPSVAHLLQQPPSPSSPTQRNHGRFLTPSNDTTHPSSPPRKRPKLDTVFSAASSATRRAHRAGGKSVSQLMARPRAGSSASAGDGLARSFTTGSLPIASGGKSNSRPGSGAGSVSGTTSLAATQSRSHRRGTSLHRVASTATLPPLSTSFSANGPLRYDSPDTPLLQPPPSAVLLPDGDATDAAEYAVARGNKAALSRIVLAALRMWGHAPPPKREKDRDREREQQREAGEVREDFKALYHATYSAARFALRHVVKREAVDGEVMRGVVERVLGVFLGGGGGVGGGNGVMS